MYWVDFLNQVLIFAILAMSLNLLMGYAGQISLATGAFAAVGGYASSYLALKGGVSILLSVVIGTVGGGMVGAVISVPALLLSGELVILLTLAVQTITIVVISSIAVLGGLFGLANLPIPHFFGKQLLLPSDWLPPLAILAFVVFVLLSWIGESPFGRILRGIRDDQLATQALGKDIFIKKVQVFALTSALAALAGALLAFYNGTVSPGLFGFDVSILVIAMVVLGGRGNLLGSALGALIVIGSEPFFEKVVQLNPDKAALVRVLCFGALLVIVLMLRPAGLLPEGATPVAFVSWLRRRRGARPLALSALTAEELAELAAEGHAERVREPKPVVQVEGVRKSFGGIRAVDGLSFELLGGRVTGLIGPNGAGKTTVFNLLTGAIPPDDGTVRLFGDDITAWPIDRIARLGMVRSFQDVRVFPALSVLDNVRMAVPNQRGESLRDLFFTPWRVLSDHRRVREAAERALGFVGLADRGHVKVSTLPFGEQKLVALARILAADAAVLLLDEPASGIDAEWVDRMVDIIGRLRDHGLTVCIVEHNLQVVERVADRIYFMEEGRITASGSMQELVKDERLVEVYFGQP
jgi:branched-chain amino acid transport system permease protein